MQPHPEGAAGNDASSELGERARSFGVVGWCSFLAASAATMVCFALLDPEALPAGEAPSWWTGRMAVYAFGFFFLWAVAAASAALTLYMTKTPPARPPSARTDR
jgi:hypothetical protein